MNIGRGRQCCDFFAGGCCIRGSGGRGFQGVRVIHGFRFMMGGWGRGHQGENLGCQPDAEAFAKNQTASGIPFAKKTNILLVNTSASGKSIASICRGECRYFFL